MCVAYIFVYCLLYTFADAKSSPSVFLLPNTQFWYTVTHKPFMSLNHNCFYFHFTFIIP
jgi:hypothetical protein